MKNIYMFQQYCEMLRIIFKTIYVYIYLNIKYYHEHKIILNLSAIYLHIFLIIF